MLCDNSLVTITTIKCWLARMSIAALAMVLLSACSAGLVSIKPSELDALQLCQQNLQQQQALFVAQQNSYSESLAVLSESLEQQKRQLEMIPPPVPATPPKAADCPKPPRTPPPPPADTPSLDKQLVGERESVLLNTADVLLRARINTGMSSSQLDARNLQTFERNGEEWVRFTVVDRETDTPHELERKRLRYVQLSKSDESSRRPVVELRITIGKLSQAAEFILVDRSNQAYPLLIGRNVLRDLMLVDVSRSNLAPVVRPAQSNTETSGDEASTQP